VYRGFTVWVSTVYLRHYEGVLQLQFTLTTSQQVSVQVFNKF